MRTFDQVFATTSKIFVCNTHDERLIHWDQIVESKRLQFKYVIFQLCIGMLGWSCVC
jgi:hypothetical protein